MTGKELKMKLAGCGVSQSEIARRLQMSQQSFNQALVVNDVKSGLLERIAQVLNVPVSFFFGENTGNNAVASGNKSVAAINSSVSSPAAEVLEERVKALETLVAEKERLINILMEGRK